jgi:cytoskeletal protein CcmA (bactofilin family)
MKGKITKILLFLALVALPLGVAHAADTKAGDSIYVAKDEIVSGNLYAAGNTITIDGTVSGDLIAAAQTVTVNGRVEGDIIVAAQNITVNGEVGGNIRVIGTAVTLNGPVARNVNAFGSNIILGATSDIGWDAYVVGSNLESRGNIDGDLSGNVGRALINGKIGKDVNLTISDTNLNQGLTISPEAVITGNISYTSKNPAQISETAKVGGKVDQQMPKTNQINWLAIWAWARVYSIFCALVVGLVLIFLGKNITTKILNKIEDKPYKMLVPGLILMFILPPIALVLMFTIIGIPLALIIIAWWLIMIYLARIFTAILVGQTILESLRKKNKDNVKLIWSLILGVIICWLLFSIPFIGWIISLVAIWLGLGAIWTYASHQLRNI